MKKNKKIPVDWSKLGNITPFEGDVYMAALSIPFGQTRSYKWLAKRIGRPNAARAVGQALKKNPFPLIIPCHRVVSSKPDCLGGFSLGLELKKELLDIENKLSKLSLRGTKRLRGEAEANSQAARFLRFARNRLRNPEVLV